jgi:hypothetical protein
LGRRSKSPGSDRAKLKSAGVSFAWSELRAALAGRPASGRRERTDYFGRKYVEVDADFLAPPAAKVAPRLIGCALHHDDRGAEIAICAEAAAYAD